MDQKVAKRTGFSRFRAILCVGFAAVFIPTMAAAKLITIEPDDYEEGTDLSNMSPYVSLSKLGLLDGEPPEPVFASAPGFDGSAPNGDLTFGHFAGGPTFCDHHLDCYAGLAITFNQPVEWVSLYALNSAYPPSLSAVWTAFDANGSPLAHGSSFGDSEENHGVPFPLHIDTPDMATLVVGGSLLTPIELDTLVIKVPEPKTLALFSLALAGIHFSRRRKTKRLSA